MNTGGHGFEPRNARDIRNGTNGRQVQAWGQAKKLLRPLDIGAGTGNFARATAHPAGTQPDRSVRIRSTIMNGNEQKDIRKIAFVGDYLPRKCGIATFTSD